MQTLLTASPHEAAAFIRRGEVVAFPTETVYGLGADAFQPAAVARIYEAKARPSDNPLIVHLAVLDQLAAVVDVVTPHAERLIERFFPGPLTLILPRHPALPPVVTAGLDTVGIRLPRHPVAQAFLTACGTPVAAPSANRSGRPSPTSWQNVLEDLEGRIPCLLQGGRAQVGLESTVVDCTGEAPLVLRAGAVTLESLQAAVPETRRAEANEKLQARSPGTRYRHYAPRARVVLVETPQPHPDAPTAYIGLTPPADPSAFALVQACTDPAQYAFEVFDFFRRADAQGVAVIQCQRIAPVGIGLALMDRLQRAAQG